MPQNWKEMVWQLDRLPGGAGAALPDFFGPLLNGPEQTSDQGLPVWTLREGGHLALERGPGTDELRLAHLSDGGEETIARLPAELLAAAADAVSPMVLALLAIAGGDVDDGRRLKHRLPAVDAAARDLMLMTLCRLCG